jgi:hypothetical protein
MGATPELSGPRVSDRREPSEDRLGAFGQGFSCRKFCRATNTTCDKNMRHEKAKRTEMLPERCMFYDKRDNICLKEVI